MSYIDELMQRKMQAQKTPVDTFKQQAESFPQEVSKSQPFIDAGLDPEMADESANYKPGTPYFDIYTKNRTKPVAPDPKKQKNNMRIAAIAQAMGILADTFAASRGANVNRRADNPVGEVAAKQKELRTLYEQKLEQYNQGMIQSQLQDASMAENWNQRQHENKVNRANRKADEERDEVKYQRRREQDMADYETKLNKQAAKEIYVAEEKPKTSSGKTSETKEEKMSPEMVVEVNAEFQKLPIAYLKGRGYTTKVKRKVKKQHPKYATQTIEEEIEEDVINTNITPEIKRALIQAWDRQQAEKNKTTTTSTTTAPPPPAPERPQVKKTWESTVKPTKGTVR